VYSELGRGSTFRIYLPRVDEVAAATEAPRPTPAAELRCSETVLVVEDDDGLRNMAGEALALFGFRVIKAASAEAALDELERSGHVDLVLTDIVMPHMSGRELARVLAGKRPEIKIVFMSGYAEQAALRHGLIDADHAFLPKPFSPEGLVRKLRSVLDVASS
jgi:two-component system cell cycle sensor histidine kinase/response regulator CckA